MDAVDCNENTPAMVQEVARVLRPGGHFIMVSCREPLERTAQLQQFFTMKVCPARLRSFHDARLYNAPIESASALRCLLNLIHA